MPRNNKDLAKNAIKALLIVTEEPLAPKENNLAASVKARSESLAPDPQREIAQMAAKARWTEWASKKAL
jgi:hypothetical protein